MLFTSDEHLLRLQQDAKRLPKGVPEMPVADQLRVRVDDARELREHQRWREFAMLLFVWPFVFALLYQVLAWLVRIWLGARAP